MRTRLKVCCIASIEEAALAIGAGSSALGLVSAMPSGAGVIDEPLIAEIADFVPPPVSRFLLTSRTEPDAVVEHVIACRVDTVQLVDAVPEATYAALRRFVPQVRIVQVLHITGPGSDARCAADRVKGACVPPRLRASQGIGSRTWWNWQSARLGVKQRRHADVSANPGFPGGRHQRLQRRSCDEPGPALRNRPLHWRSHRWAARRHEVARRSFSD